MVDAIAYLTVGVADFAPARALWVEYFGLEIVAERSGPDVSLATLWGIDPDRIAGQWVLATPGATTGHLHFVQFNDPAAPVRTGAATTDLGPKNIDVNCVDIEAHHDRLRRAGFRFRSPINEYEIDGIRAREVQMPAHDEINVVLVEVLSSGFEIEYSPAGCGALTSFVVIVPDTGVDAEFFAEVFGLDELMHHRIAGPAIEQVVGLPPGAALDMRLMGREENMFGRVELICYEGISGVDRFPLARPPALGVLHCGFTVESLDGFARHAMATGVDLVRYDNLNTLFGAGAVGVLSSPSGLRIEVVEAPISHR